MLKLYLVGVFLLFTVSFVRGDEAMIGPGKWKIYHIEFKEATINDIIIDLQQSMYNRTHYVYSGEIITNEPLNDGLGFKMDMCKYVDGGCKQFMVLTDDSFVSFANKYAKENIKECFTILGIDPPELPLDKGKYEVNQFLFDTSQLPQEAAYGRFIAELCAMRGTVAVGCITCEFEFEEKRDSDEDDE